jgi:hypothetical protein
MNFVHDLTSKFNIGFIDLATVGYTYICFHTGEPDIGAAISYFKNNGWLVSLDMTYQNNGYTFIYVKQNSDDPN